MTRLLLENLSAYYGASQALFDVNLTVDEGEVVALMGRNGMGKSTTIKCICRIMPSTGKLRFNDIDIQHLPSFKAARLGIGLVPEGRRCFQTLSVHENLIASARDGHWNFPRVSELFPRLGERKNQLASTLSGGEQQMLAIGRALMTNPSLLILDEATEGLAPLVRQEIWAAIKYLKEQSGISILIVDKSIKELRDICDRATILERGLSVWDGNMQALDTTILEKYVGV